MLLLHSIRLGRARVGGDVSNLSVGIPFFFFFVFYHIIIYYYVYGQYSHIVSIMTTD